MANAKAGAAIGSWLSAAFELTADERAKLEVACGSTSPELIAAIEYAIGATYRGEAVEPFLPTEREVAKELLNVSSEALDFMRDFPASGARFKPAPNLDGVKITASARAEAWRMLEADPTSRDDLNGAIEALCRLAKHALDRAKALDANAQRKAKRPAHEINSLIATVRMLFKRHGISTSIPSDSWAFDADNRSPLYRTCRLAIAIVADRLRTAAASGAMTQKAAKRAEKISEYKDIAFCRLLRRAKVT